MGLIDQSGVIGFLSDPATHRVESVETIETHISLIFLADERAYKLKRDVRLPYVDFSTPELRLATCRRELELNFRTAPELYLGVRRITRGVNGRLEFDGTGPLVDAVVEMKRFDQSALFSSLAQAGALTPALMTETARMIRRFHQGAPVVRSGGGAANIEGVLDINRAGFATGRVFSEPEIGALDDAFRSALARHAPLLDRREAEGKVRRCHGDLHLRNICLIDGRPRLFDCIEFNEAIATVDVLYDLAFLLMDLWHRDFPQLANLVANRYFDEADEEESLVLLTFFMAIRAAVRAHVTATQATAAAGTTGELAAEARRYFALAEALLSEPSARLVAIGGLSGSGKTTISEALAAHVGPPPGARLLESDRIRKALHGVSAETSLPASAYRPEISERVYGEMARRAGLILSAGGTVLGNAVFDRASDRERIERVAGTNRAAFAGIWLAAAPDVLRHRIAGRMGGPSDATLDVLASQLARDPGDIAWWRLDTASDVSVTVAAILDHLRESGVWAGAKKGAKAPAQHPLEGPGRTIMPKNLPQNFRHVRLLLARSKEHPHGDPNTGYDLVVPLDDDGRLDAETWKTHRTACRVRYFSRDGDERIGRLERKPNGQWYFDYEEGEEDDEIGFRLGDESFVMGEYVSIDTEQVMRTYQVAQVERSW